MRQVFNNSELAHVWTTGSQEEGRNANGSFYFVGDVIYSYGAHFPIAKKLDRNRVLVTSRGYSNTTAKHISLVLRAIPRDWQMSVVDDVLPQSKEDHKKNLNDIVKRIFHAAGKYRRARNSKEYWGQTIYNEVIFLFRYRDWFKCGRLPKVVREMPKPRNPYDLVGVFRVLDVEYKERTEAERKAEAKRKREEKKKREERKKRLFSYVDDWRNSKPIPVSLYDLPVMLRVNQKGDRIETSHGATVLLRSARALWLSVCSGRLLEKIDGFDCMSFADGVLTIGCHKIPVDEIKALATTLGWQGNLPNEIKTQELEVVA